MFCESVIPIFTVLWKVCVSSLIFYNHFFFKFNLDVEKHSYNDLKPSQ